MNVSTNSFLRSSYRNFRHFTPMENYSPMSQMSPQGLCSSWKIQRGFSISLLLSSLLRILLTEDILLHVIGSNHCPICLLLDRSLLSQHDCSPSLLGLLFRLSTSTCHHRIQHYLPVYSSLPPSLHYSFDERA